MASTDLPQREGANLVAVVPDRIDPGSVLDFVAASESGAVVLFLGTVRDHSPGKTGVTHLEYEAYEDVVEEKIREIVAEAGEKWPIRRAAAVHRTGELGVGEISVAVAVSSAHRADAFAAGRYLIDELKSRAPIWKKEHWPGGAEWVREDREH
jgi:molybdopterin synthase catalytic subunit